VTLLDRYILSAFARVFFLSLAAFVGIYLLVDFFERVDDFIAHQARISLYILYFANKIPVIAVQVAPLAVLMGTFMTLGGLTRTNELTAMRAAGIGLFRITAPLLTAALLLALLTLGTNEYLVPLSVKKINYLFQTELKGEAPQLITRDRIWLREGNRIVNIRYAVPGQGVLRGITIFSLGDDFRLRQRTDADQAVFTDGRWNFENATERSFDPESGALTATDHRREAPGSLDRPPEEFGLAQQDNEELGFRQLRELSAKLEADGYDSTRYRVDMQGRLATPFASLIMAFLGIPFALRTARGASLALGIGLSVGIGVTFYIFQATLLAFGYSGILPPAVAAWAPNLLFLLLGLWLMLSTRN
jgi:lipopolysaccharide export system permease protein